MPPSLSKMDSSGYIVIGAGLPRTGTTSLYAALEQILGPTYHMKVMFKSKGHADPDFWERALKRMATADDWRRFVGERGLRAGVDYPISFYWREQMRIFPEAKVILTARSPDSWYNSVKGTVYQFSTNCQGFPFSWFLSMFGRIKHSKACNEICWAIPDGFDISTFGAVSEGQEAALEFYNKWAEEVKAAVPKERLLIHEAKDGWAPLCKFLDLPIPSTPYPHENDSKSMQSHMAGVSKFVHFVVYGIPVLVAAAAAVGYYYYYH